MERILVGLDLEEVGLWAGIHALNLAKRINAQVAFLLAIEPCKDKRRRAVQEKRKASLMKSLGPLIEKGRAEGIGVDYYVVYGTYDSELVRFIKENRITMLVVESPFNDHRGSSGHFRDLLEKVRHRIDCRIEVVHEKNLKHPLGGGDNAAPVSADRWK